MNSFIQEVFLFLIRQPGNLAYHLVIVFALFGALQGAANFSRPDRQPQDKRILLGVGVLLFLQLAQSVTAASAYLGYLDYHLVLPVLDRGLYLFSLVVLIWLWLVPYPSRLGDTATAILAVLTITGVLLGMVWWITQLSGGAFNGSWPDVLSQGYAIALITICIIILAVKRLPGWGIGLAMFSMLILGSVLHLWLDPFNQDYSGALRLTQMAAYPWLLALSQRFPASFEKLEKESKAADVPERRRHNIDPKAVYEFLNLASAQEPEKFVRDIPRGVAHLMLADYCLLVLPPDATNQVNIPLVFNLIEEKNLEGFTIDGRKLPGILAAMQRGKILRLPSSSASADLDSLARYMQLGKIGPLMVAPITTGKEEKVKFGLLLVSPYSNRTWSAEDQSVMENVTAFLGRLLSRPANVPATPEQESLQERLDTAQHYARQMQEENHRLLAQLDIMQRQSVQDRTRAESLAALISGQEPANGEDRTLPSMPKDMVPLDDYHFLDGELRKSLEQVAELRLKLAELQQEPKEETPAGQGSMLNATEAGDVLSLIQELRQPLTSISGYTDVLLLDESAASPGSQVRKFLERIKTSVERMTGLADDLIQMTNLTENSTHLSPELIDLNDIIDDAIATAMKELREKNLLLRVDITDDLPEFEADRAALEKVLALLLKNAGTCTAEDGEITLRARAELKEHEPGYILIQVSDTGSGISPDDLPHIFSIVYRQRHKDIPGIGVSAEDLAEVKVAVEAHGGRIWVDSLVGQGSTFSTLFPLAEEGLGVR